MAAQPALQGGRQIYSESQLKVDEEKDPQIESIQERNMCGQCGPVPATLVHVTAACTCIC